MQNYSDLGSGSPDSHIDGKKLQYLCMNALVLICADLLTILGRGMQGKIVYMASPLEHWNCDKLIMHHQKAVKVADLFLSGLCFIQDHFCGICC